MRPIRTINLSLLPKSRRLIAAAVVIVFAGVPFVAVAGEPPPPPLAGKPPGRPQANNREVPKLLMPAGPTDFQMQPAQNGAFEAGAQESRNVMAVWSVELLFVKKVCAPSREQFRAIKRDLRTLLMKAQRGAIESSCDLLPQQITDCVVKHLSQSAAAKYRTELAKRDAHEREGCVYTVVVGLDDRLNLSEDQRQTLVASLTANWKPAWSQIVEMAVRNGTSPIPALPESLLAPMLDHEQLRKWHDLPKTDANPAALPFDGLRIGVLGTPDDQTVDISPDEGGP
jgi:hypothetical protein